MDRGCQALSSCDHVAVLRSSWHVAAPRQRKCWRLARVTPQRRWPQSRLNAGAGVSVWSLWSAGALSWGLCFCRSSLAGASAQARKRRRWQMEDFLNTTPVIPSPFGKLPGARQAEFFLASTTTGIVTAVLVFLICLLYAFSTLQLAPHVVQVAHVGEYIINGIFCVEFVTRWYSRNLRPSYVLKWEMLVDLVAILPFISGLLHHQLASLEFMQVLRILRSVRGHQILRLRRFLRNRESFARFVGHSISPFTFRCVQCIVTIFMLVFLSAGLIYNAEHAVNPEFSNFFVTAYFVLVTLTTVGFGDLHPVTPVGRTVVCLTILLGCALVPLELSKVIEESHFLDGKDTEQEDNTGSPSSQNDAQDASFRAEVMHRLDALAQQQQQLRLLVTRSHERQQQQQHRSELASVVLSRSMRSELASVMLSRSMRCSRCGVAIPCGWDARFCYKCGAMVAPA